MRPSSSSSSSSSGAAAGYASNLRAALARMYAANQYFQPYAPLDVEMNDVSNAGRAIPEYVGRQRNPEWTHRILNPLEDLRAPANLQARLRDARLRNILLSLPFGYAADINVAGLTIREVRDIILNLHLDPSQYAISGIGYDCTVGESDVFNCRRKDFRNINLVEINFPHIDTLHYDAQDFLNWVRNYRRESGGSDLSAWILYGHVSICRMNTYPTYAQIRFRTAGYDLFIPFPVTFSFIVPPAKEYTVYIAGGVDNCVHSCLQWSLEMATLQEAVRMNPELLQQPDTLRAQQEIIRAGVTARVRNILHTFQDQYVESRLANSAGRIARNGGRVDVVRRQIAAEYERTIKHGYSSIFLKRLLDKLLTEEDISVRFGSRSVTGTMQKMWYAYEPTPAWHMLRGRGLDVHPTYVAMLRVGLDGSISITGNNQVADIDNSNLAHAVAIHPAPTYREPRLTEFMNIVEEHLRRHFAQLKELANGLSLTRADAALLPRLVECQNARMSMKVAAHMAAHASSSSSAPSPPSSSNNRFARKVYVIAFDIETVENLRGVQTNDTVYEPFIMPPPTVHIDAAAAAAGVVVDDFTIPLAQIPYTVQWGLVDMSPAGVSPYVTGGGVTIEYGRNLLGKCLLGKCVTDFLDGVRDRILALTRGEGKVKCYAYAHNASGFDAYMLKIYNHKYDVKKLLSTPRGILSITFSLGHGIDLVVRDTKVFFAASLKDLCTIFRVPARYCKTDFPITLIHARNYDHPNVQTIVREYMENDVYSLAIIVHDISKIIQQIEERTAIGAAPAGAPPAITRYVTLMSIVKKAQALHFTKTLRTCPPLPVDIAALRKWINYGNVGGRVMPFWRGYASRHMKDIISSYIAGDVDTLRSIHAQLLATGECMRVLDVTSLYPYVMAEYPMPSVADVPLVYLSPEECMQKIHSVECSDCVNMWRTCPAHSRGGALDWIQEGLAFILVTELQPPPKSTTYLNICPRKLLGGGLIYTHETDEELLAAAKDRIAGAPPTVQCYTHWDLHWLRAQGFTYTAIGGFLFATSYAGYSDNVHASFNWRKEAKAIERESNLPKSLSTFIKLKINGGYGVNAQRDITSSTLVVDSSDEGLLRSNGIIKPDEYICREVAYTHRMHNGQWVLRVDKYPHSCEYYAEQSPNHIGAAVVATARHHVNLALLSLCVHDSVANVSYTDTDSLCVYLRTCREVMPAAIYDESADAAMGTYKNDHERGKEEVVVLSYILRKKVKLHVTLDAEGVLRFYPTFTGFNPSPRDATTGDVLPGHLVERARVLALSNIFYTGAMQEHTQTEFRRSMHAGVVIDNNAKISGEYASFWHHSAGGLLCRLGEGGVEGDYCEKLVPLGLGECYDDNAAYVDYGAVAHTPTFPPATATKRNVFWTEALGHSATQWYAFLELYYARKDAAYSADTAMHTSPEMLAERETMLRILKEADSSNPIEPADSNWRV